MENSRDLLVVLESSLHPFLSLILLYHAIKEEDELDANSCKDPNKLLQSGEVFSPLATTDPRLRRVPVSETTHGIYHNGRRASGVLVLVLLCQLSQVHHCAYMWARTAHKSLQTSYAHH